MCACREEKAEEPEQPKYRDRAKERREDQNPDYEATALGHFHAVAPPGTVDLRYNKLALKFNYVDVLSGFALANFHRNVYLFIIMVTGLLMSTSYPLKRVNTLEVCVLLLLLIMKFLFLFLIRLRGILLLKSFYYRGFGGSL